MFGETGSRRPVALASHVGAPVTCSHCKKRQIEDGRERLKLENVFTGCQTRVNDELQFCFFPPFLLLGGVRQQTASLTYDLSTFPCGPSGSVWRADKFIIPIRLRFSKSISRQIRTAHYYRSWNFHLLKVIKLIEHVSAGRCARWYGWKVNGRMRNYSNTRWPSKCKWVIFISSNYMWEVKENGIESRERVCISSDRTSESVRVSSLFFLSNFLSLLLILLIVFFCLHRFAIYRHCGSPLSRHREKKTQPPPQYLWISFFESFFLLPPCLISSLVIPRYFQWLLFSWL